MTKQEFCRQIVETVDNCRSIDGMSDEQIVIVIGGLIAPLEPKNKKKFAAWGQPQHQTTPQKCW